MGTGYGGGAASAATRGAVAAAVAVATATARVVGASAASAASAAVAVFHGGWGWRGRRQRRRGRRRRRRRRRWSWRRRRGVGGGGVGGLAARGLSARPNPRSRRGGPLPRGPDTRNRTSNPDSWVLPRRTTIGGETHFTVPVKGRATPMGNRARYGRAAQRRWPNKKALGQRGHTF